MSRFSLNVRCNNCDSIFESNGHDASFYNSFRSNICIECGHRGFYDKSERWVGESVWWKPTTWGDGRWEEAK